MINHQSLFIFIDPGYAGSYHDVTILRVTTLARNWQSYFNLEPNAAEPTGYLLGDPRYLGADHFTLRRIDARELSFVDIDPVIKAFNEYHSGY